LSKDKGFDPLVKHLAKRGFAVQRAITLGEVFPQAAAPASELVDRQPPTQWEAALQWLAGMQKNKRPRKRKGLVAHLYNHFSRKITEEEIQEFVARMIAGKKLTDTGGALTYHL
jgi:hypothetical protein